MTNEELKVAVDNLKAMKNRAKDGRGAYLGNGMPGLEVRAFDMADALTELLAWRTQVPDFEYDKETGVVEYTGDIIGEDN